MSVSDQYLTSNVGSDQIWLKHQIVYPDLACRKSNETFHHIASKFKKRCLHNECNINQNKCQRRGYSKNKKDVYFKKTPVPKKMGGKKRKRILRNTLDQN